MDVNNLVLSFFTIDCVSYQSHLTQRARERISANVVPLMAPSCLLFAAFSAQVLPVAVQTSY